MLLQVVRRDPLADPQILSGLFIDDYAESWARRLMIPAASLARRHAEPDVDYRPRLLALLAQKLEPHR